MLCTIAFVAAAWPAKASVNETVPLSDREVAHQPQRDDVALAIGIADAAQGIENLLLGGHMTGLYSQGRGIVGECCIRRTLPAT